jgi:hypothetical protein
MRTVIGVIAVKKHLVRISLKETDKTMRWLIAIWLVLQAVDVWLTLVLLARPNMFELNPFAASWIIPFGITGMVLAKMLVAVPIVYFVGMIYPRLGKSAKHSIQGVYTGLVIWYAFIMVWNIDMLIRSV